MNIRINDIELRLSSTLCEEYKSKMGKMIDQDTCRMYIENYFSTSFENAAKSFPQESLEKVIEQQLVQDSISKMEVIYRGKTIHINQKMAEDMEKSAATPINELFFDSCISEEWNENMEESVQQLSSADIEKKINERMLLELNIMGDYQLE